MHVLETGEVGLIRERTEQCAACGCKVLKVVRTVPTSQGLTARLMRCRRCRLVQVSPLPSEEELKSVYTAYSYLAPQSWVVPPAVQQSLAALISSFERFRQSNKLLDVGCGAGHLLRAAQQQGWDVSGTELSDVAVDRMREEGLAAYYGDLPTLPLPAATFDVITMGEVLEHLRYPAEYVRTAFQLLRPGGALYLTTPNFASLTSRVLRERWRIIEVPEHIFYFSPTSLRHLLKEVGFRSVSVRTEGTNPAELYLCLKGGRRQESAARAAESTAMLRDAAHNNSLLRVGKRVVNTVLRLTRTGDSLKVLAIK